MKLFLAAIIFTICNIAFVAAQTATEIESKYGKPIQMYEVRPGVFMNVKFDANGQASEIRVERHNMTDSISYLDTTFPADLLKEVIDELVPLAKRGARINESSAFMLVTGGAATQTLDYENVSITYEDAFTGECSGTIGMIIKWKSRLPKQK